MPFSLPLPSCARDRDCRSVAASASSTFRCTTANTAGSMAGVAGADFCLGAAMGDACTCVRSRSARTGTRPGPHSGQVGLPQVQGRERVEERERLRRLALPALSPFCLLFFLRLLLLWDRLLGEEETDELRAELREEAEEERLLRVSSEPGRECVCGGSTLVPAFLGLRLEL